LALLTRLLRQPPTFNANALPLPMLLPLKWQNLFPIWIVEKCKTHAIFLFIPTKADNCPTTGLQLLPQGRNQPMLLTSAPLRTLGAGRLASKSPTPAVMPASPMTAMAAATGWIQPCDLIAEDGRWEVWQDDHGTNRSPEEKVTEPYPPSWAEVFGRK
jgi:hypothetical protein